LQIQKYLKNSNDGQLVIGDIIRAKHFASTAATQRSASNRRLKDFERAQEAIAVLQPFLVQNADLFLGLLAIDLEEMVSSLSRLQTGLDASAAVEKLGRDRISRVSRSGEGQRTMFAVHMVWTMRSRFGKPCAGAVADLTSVAFQSDFDTAQVSDGIVVTCFR
jgi:hypothetical protein